ncbi:hypothetical protein, partial [Methanobacterium sp. 42_16]|uniref:hypothetical protein n=1 Tax=Methanobacterium sp. 42_16 TaxID=1641383 RepID=UPI00373FCB51
MIILVIALVLGVGSVAAASQDNTSQTNNSTSITTVPETHTDNTVNSDPATPADPQIWRDGAPVARGGHPAGYQYSTIAEAINDALDGDTIMLES